MRFSPDTPLSKSLWHFLEMTAYFYSSLPILPQHSVHGKGDILGNGFVAVKSSIVPLT